MAGFNTAVTGIKATTTALDVTGNNISNASTVGFKSTRAEFADIYATQVVGAGSSNIAGAGVLISDLSQDFSSGTIEFTNSNLDLAINGSGFFQLDDGQGGLSYTRAGAFELDKEGNIVSKNGKHLRGYGLDAQGNILPLKNLRVEEKESPPHATEKIDLSINLQPNPDLDKKADYYDKNNPSSFAYTTTVETFDSLGNTQSIKFNYVEQKPQREFYQYNFTNAPLNVNNAPVVNGVQPAPVGGQAAGVMTLSGVPLQWNAPAAAGDPQTLNTATIALLEAADSRIDTATVRYIPQDNTATPPVVAHIEFKLKSEATGQGDIVLVQGDGTVAGVNETPDNLDSQGRPKLVDANEVMRVPMMPSAATATAFDAAGGGDDDALTVAMTINVGGVNIALKQGLSRDQVGELIVDQHESAIKENDPKIESVSYDTATNELVITWKPEAGNVYPPGETPFRVEGNVNPAATETASVFTPVGTGAGAAQNVTRTYTEGDNSYLGAYRVYAYLNGDQLLNIGKGIDPGESGGVADFVELNKSTEPGPVMIKFSSVTGLLDKVNGADVKDQDNVPKLTIRGADQANPNDEKLKGDLDNLRGVQFDISGTTRWNSASIVKSQSQDGYSKGDLIGVTFDERGYMVASYSNGQKKDIGIVAMATFESQSGLQPAGDTEWVPTLDSGQARLNPPGTGLNGTIRSGALEQSNVDLSSELVKLIEFQRNYQANSKTLETLNTVTQSILQI